MRLRWPRVWPPCSYVTAALLAHAAFAVAVVWLRVDPTGPETKDHFRSLLRTPYVPLFAALVYGIYRVGGFHPAAVPGYLEWLVRTPWTPRKPLPLGPVDLTPADAALLALMVATAWPFYGIDLALLVVKVFAFVYLLTLMGVLFAAGRWYPACAVWFGVDAMALPGVTGWPFVGVTALTYAAGLWGLRLSLDAIPTAVPPGLSPGSPDRPSASPESRRRTVGWPFGYLAPVVDNAAWSRWQGLVASLLAGWTGYAVMSWMPDTLPRGWVIAGLGLTGVALNLHHASEFLLSQYESPLTLAGRVATGRWIVPANDKKWIPLTLPGVALVPAFVLVEALEDRALAVGLSFAMVFLAYLMFRPDRSRWLLCAGVRIVPRLPPGRGGSPAWVRVSL